MSGRSPNSGARAGSGSRGPLDTAGSSGRGRSSPGPRDVETDGGGSDSDSRPSPVAVGGAESVVAEAYSDAKAVARAALEVASRPAVSTTVLISRSLPIRKRWNSRAPAGVSRSVRDWTAASISRCSRSSSAAPAALAEWALSTAVTTCRSTWAAVDF